MASVSWSGTSIISNTGNIVTIKDYNSVSVSTTAGWMIIKDPSSNTISESNVVDMAFYHQAFSRFDLFANSILQGRPNWNIYFYDKANLNGYAVQPNSPLPLGYDGGNVYTLSYNPSAAIPLQVNVVAQPISGETPLPVQFSGFVTGGTGNNTTKDWYNGETLLGSGDGLNYTFTQAGNYFITFHVTDTAGNSAFSGVGVAASVGTSPLTVSLTLDNTTANQGNTVSATASINGGQTPYSSTWTLTDPTGASTNISANLNNATFTVPLVGTYTLKISVNDSSSPPKLQVATASVQVSAAVNQGTTNWTISAIDNASNFPLGSGVAITITGPSGTQTQSTDTTGQTIFMNLKPGAYSVSATASGYNDYSNSFSISGSSSNNTLYMVTKTPGGGGGGGGGSSKTPWLIGGLAALLILASGKRK